MLEYKPWSDEELRKGFAKYKEGKFNILDIELSGTCNFNCVYCDSPDHRKRCTIKMSDIERLLAEGGFEWIYICGLGEPTSGQNYKYLMKVLKLCKIHSVKCSIFSNVLYLTNELIKYIDEGILYILFKFDSADYKLNANLYCTSYPKAKKQYNNILALKDHVISSNSYTNIAASIVPTRLNVKEIPFLIEYCLDNNMYPLLADLENSGRGQDHFSVLSLSEQERSELKSEVENQLGKEYHIPICPAVVSGIHISHDSKIVVDEVSGLTCPWFWLEEPKLFTVMKLTNTTNIENIMRRVIAYRNEKLEDIIHIANRQSMLKKRDFGGCGGDIQELLISYIDLQKSLGCCK